MWNSWAGFYLICADIPEGDPGLFVRGDAAAMVSNVWSFEIDKCVNGTDIVCESPENIATFISDL